MRWYWNMPKCRPRFAFTKVGALCHSHHRFVPLLIHDEHLLPDRVKPVRKERRALRKPPGRIVDQHVRPQSRLSLDRWLHRHRYKEPLGLYLTALFVHESARVAVVDLRTGLAELSSIIRGWFASGEGLIFSGRPSTTMVCR